MTEAPRPDPDAITRTTVGSTEIRDQAASLSLPPDADATKVVRAGTAEIRRLQQENADLRAMGAQAGDLTLEQWARMGAKFYRTERT